MTTYLPPASMIAGLTLEQELAPLIAEADRITARLREVRGANQRADARLRAAQDRDLDAAAAARRAGKPDPGRVHETEEHDAIEASRREEAVLVRQRAAVDADVAKLLGDARQRTEAEIDELLEAEAIVARDRLAEYRASRQRIADLRAIRAWLASGASARPARVFLNVPALDGLNLARVLDALEELDAVPDPRPVRTYEDGTPFREGWDGYRRHALGDRARVEPEPARAVSGSARTAQARQATAAPEPVP